ncbi:uncharacterized protein LOC143896586 [Temnothorax americanus]|uniref:uncharacterized protein LOC143896586 n=1 Tax=Temnothorax americanus TaxID=1964332 RepID=UPI004069681E
MRFKLWSGGRFAVLSERNDRIRQKNSTKKMVRRCCAPNCKSRDGQGITLFSIPKEKDRREIWIKIIRRVLCNPNWNPHSKSSLCETHFDGNQWEMSRMDGLRKLRISVVPTSFYESSILNKTSRRPSKHQSSHSDHLYSSTPLCDSKQRIGRGDHPYSGFRHKTFQDIGNVSIVCMDESMGSLADPSDTTLMICGDSGVGNDERECSELWGYAPYK